MSAMGELNFFLGLQVLQKKDVIFLSQDKYVGDILKKFRYLDVRSANTPMDKENPWRKDGTGKDWEHPPLAAGTPSTGSGNLYCQQHNMYSIDLNNIVLHKDLTCLVAKASADEESSSSKPQDDCSTDVPESNGNSNPTATSTNLSADQMETLTVETPIPTVSSPVPTACFIDSQEPSSDTRLFSKRVANQVETPSLDNILTLINRFVDILRVTTNSDELNGVEADVSNLETTITASLDLHSESIIYQMDVKSTFLYGTIDEEVYDPEFPARVYKVEKAMYGLHQAPRAWYGTLSKYLLTNGFQRDVKSANTPMDKENPLGKDRTGKDVDLHLYRSMIGSLMYLNTSIPDIMLVVCNYARHQVTPKECHLHAVKRIFRYLKGHPKPGLQYPKESPFDLAAYSDSDYVGATQDRKSTTRGCQFLGRRLISWQCKKQTIVATSTTEAEYVAAASCCGQVLWIQNQLLDYG
nr:hypothetical protein [Tanacetum cinerariifolium]